MIKLEHQTKLKFSSENTSTWLLQLVLVFKIEQWFFFSPSLLLSSNDRLRSGQALFSETFCNNCMRINCFTNYLLYCKSLFFIKSIRTSTPLFYMFIWYYNYFNLQTFTLVVITILLLQKHISVNEHQKISK